MTRNWRSGRSWTTPDLHKLEHISDAHGLLQWMCDQHSLLYLIEADSLFTELGDILWKLLFLALSHWFSNVLTGSFLLSSTNNNWLIKLTLFICRLLCQLLVTHWHLYWSYMHICNIMTCTQTTILHASTKYSWTIMAHLLFKQIFTGRWLRSTVVVKWS